jgi:hypothetical protein
MKAVARTVIDDGRLTEDLARLVMGLRSTPDRYLKPGRSWLPKWRFAPLERLEDAFQLLRAANQYTLSSDQNRVFTAEIQIGRRTGQASGEPKARTITIAVGRALGLEI